MADFDTLWAEVQAEEERDRVRANLAGPNLVAPDVALAGQRAEAATGVPAAAAESVPLLREAPSLTRDLTDLDVSPRLRAYLAEPRNAAVARDDVRPLRAWESMSALVAPALLSNPMLAPFAAFTGMSAHTLQRTADGRLLSDTNEALRRGQRDIEMRGLFNRSNLQTWRDYDTPNAFSEADRGRLKALEFEASREQPLSFYGQVVSQLPQIPASFDAAFRRSARDIAASLNEVYGDEPRSLNLRSAAEMAVLAPIAGVGAASSGAGGFVRGMVGFGYEQEAGGAYQEYLGMVDQAGNPLDPVIAGRAARAVGTINAAIEFVGTGALAKVAGIDTLAARLTGAGVRDALRRAGYRAAVGRLGWAALGGGASEGFEELSQESVTIALGLMAQAEQGGEFDQATPDEIADRLFQSFAIGSVVGAGLGGAIASPGFGIDVADIQRMQAQGEMFAALGDAAAASRLRARSPGRYAEAVNALTQGGPLETFRVDGERFAAFFQDQDQDPFEIAERLQGVGREALQHALESGGEVAIPAGTYASQIVGTPADAALRPHVRLGAGRMTPAEVAARMEIGVDLERATGEARRLYTEALAAEGEREQVFERIRDMLDVGEFTPSATRDKATVLTANIVTMARRNGESPLALMDRIGLDIRGPFEGQSTRAVRDEVLARLDAAGADVPANETPRARIRVAYPRADGGSRVSARPATEDGEIETSWAKLQVRAGRDMVVGEAQNDARPVRRDIFEATYEEVAPGEFQKRTDTPVGYYVLDEDRTIETLEGAVDAKKGDYVLIGAVGEQWPVRPAKFRERYREQFDPYAHFGGVQAIGAPLHTLQTARVMEANGASEQKIWRETGWARGLDGMWRWEIDDSRADWKHKVLDRFSSKTHLGEVIYYQGDIDAFLSFDELFAAYPVLGSLRLTLHIGPYNTHKFERPGGWIGSDELYVRADTRERALEIVMHELQHAIQWIEAFSPGGSARTVIADATWAQMGSAQTDLSVAFEYFYRFHLSETLAQRAWSPGSIERYPALHRDAMDYARQQAAFDVYQRVLGEAEARAVQLRRGSTFATRRKSAAALTPEERRQTAPSESFDVDPRWAISLPPMQGSLVTLRGDGAREQSRGGVDIYGDRRPAGLGEGYGADPANQGAPSTRRMALEEVGDALAAVARRIEDGAETPPTHRNALRFGTEQDVADLRAMIARGASAEEILSSPIMRAVEQHSAETPWTATKEQAIDPDFIDGREYVDPRTGETVDAEEAIERLKSIYEAKAGGEVRQGFHAVIVVGHPGAGKSTFINGLARANGAAVLDADIAKEFVPSYDEGYNSQSVHFESAALRSAAQADFLDAGVNVIVERVGDSEIAIRHLLDDLKKTGYTASIVHVAVDGDEAARRMASRFLSGGRYVDPAIFRAVINKPAPAFARIIESADLTGYVEINANGPPGQIQIEKSGGADAPALISAIGGGARSGALDDGRTQAAGRAAGEASGAQGPGYAQGEVAPAARRAGYRGRRAGEAVEWLRALEKFGPEGMLWTMPDGSPGPRQIRAREGGYIGPYYTGANRADRLAGGIKNPRARSGPTIFSTDNPETATGYAVGKPDTTRMEEDDGLYEHWFKVKIGRGKPKTISQAWFYLSQEERARILELLPQVTERDRDAVDGGVEFFLEMADGPAGRRHWDDLLRSHRGNALAAAVELWLESGILFNREDQFLAVLKQGGMTTSVMNDNPHHEQPGVFPWMIRVRNAFDTGDAAAIAALRERLLTIRAPRVRRKFGNDQWDKRAIPLKEWLSDLEADIENGTTYAWTRVPDVVTQELRAMGYDAISDRGGKMGPGQIDHAVLIPLDASQVRSVHAAFDPEFQDEANLLAQASPRTGPRGYFTPGYGRDGELNSAVINLLEARNLSTVFHEAGHLNLELLFDFARAANAPDGIKADAQTVLEWFGDGLTLETWQAMSIDQRRPYHEMFARGFEAYLLEGKAPSTALRQVFATVKAWLIQIYKSVLALKVDLTPEIRGVMDRLLASEEEIAAAQKLQGADAVMSREAFGGTDKQYARYLANIARAREDAETDLQATIMGAVFADRTRWWRSEERRQRETVEIDIDSQPVRQLYDWLSTGTWRHGPKPDWLTEDVRLSLAAVVRDYGQDAVDALPDDVKKLDVEQLQKIAVATRVALNKRGPQRLADWLLHYARKHGGIVDESGGLQQVIDGKRGFGRVINDRGGRHLDDVALAAREAGYFGAPPGRAVEGYAQFGGRRADTANLDTLKLARELERGGKDTWFIWANTGWGRGLDGQWKYWIDDKDLRWKVDLRSARRRTTSRPLSELIEWPALFEAYPQLAAYRVDFDDLEDFGGYFASIEKGVWGSITIDRKNRDPLGVLRHEIQHAVQEIEGFARGYNPNRVKRNSAEWNAAIEHMRRRQMRRGVRDEDMDRFIDSASIYVYRHEAGEVEAEEVRYRAIVGGMYGSDTAGWYDGISFSAAARAQPPSEPYSPWIDKENVWINRHDSYAQDGVRNGERPTIREFLDKLNEDIRNDSSPAYSTRDAEEVAARLEYEGWRRWFDEHGVDLKADAKTLRAQIERAVAKTDEGGLHPDALADMFGIDNGEALLRGLSQIEPREQAIKAELRKRMMAEFGDPLNDGTIAEEARLAAHRESRARVIELELEALARATGRAARPLNAAAKAIAERQIESMTVRQIRGYDWFLGNERREARNAVEAIQRGDMMAAEKHKHRQLVNFHLYRLARAAAEEMDVAQRYLKKFSRSGVRENIDGDYLDQIDALLAQFELRKRSGPQQARLANLGQWAADMEARGLGHLVNVDPRRIADAAKRPFAHLPIDEARGLVDTIKNIEHLGRLKEKLLAAANQRKFRETVSEVAAQIRETGPSSPATRRTYTPNAMERAQDWVRRAHAEMTRMEFLFKHLDGKANGPVWRALWAPLAAAADKESVLMRDATKGMEAIWARYTQAERARMFTKRIDTPSLPVDGPAGRSTSFTKAEIMTIALNWGNEGNRTALLNGFRWEETDVKAVLDRVLDERDWQSVQMIWDLIGTFRDEAFALQYDLTGVRPQAVEALPVETPFGTLRGGYYPLKYDGERNLVVARRDEMQTQLEAMGSNWHKPMTRKGHLEARVGSGGRPVKLSLDVFTEHVQNVAHDIAYRRAVIDIDRIIQDEEFAGAFIEANGRPMYDQLRPWLQSIAADRSDPTAWMWRFLQKLRGNVAIAAMGYRLSTSLQQVTGLLQAVPELGSLEMTGALAKLVRNPATMFAKAAVIEGKSEFMRSRRQTLDRDIRETIERMEKTDALYHIRHNAFALVGAFDWMVSAVVWTAAYDKAMGGNVKGVDTADEAAAIGYADSMVRTTQSAGLNQDLPAIMRGSQTNKLLTMFFSYFSVLYNWTTNQVLGVRKGRIPPHVFIGNLALIYVIAPFLAEALAGRLVPREGEDEEERNLRVAMVIAKMPFATIPVVRDVVNVVGTSFDYQLSPVEAGPAQIARALQDAAAGRTFDSENTAKTAVNALGYAFGLPSGQAWVMIDYLVDHLEGEEEGFDFHEAVVSDRR